MSDFDAHDMLTSILAMMEMSNQRVKKAGKDSVWWLVTTGGDSCVIRHNESGASFRITVEAVDNRIPAGATLLPTKR